MKQKFHFRFLFVAIVILSIGKSNAQGVGNHVTMSLENYSQTSSTTMEFDLVIVSDGAGTSDLRLNSLQYGINLDTTILQIGSTLTTSYLTGTSDFIPPLASFTFLASSFPGHIRIAESAYTGGNTGNTMIIGQKYRAGRFRLTCSANWTGNNPNFSLQSSTAGGKTVCAAIVWIGTAPSTTSFVTTGTGDGQRSVSANFNSCTYSTSVNYSDESCAGSTDGSIAVSVNSATPPISYLWSTGATSSSLSNLSSGAYQVSVTDSSGCLISRYIWIKVKAPYCKYNIVKGVCFVDNNNNGVKDAGEPGYTGSMIISQGGAINYSSQPDAQGVFSNYADSGTSVTSLQNIMPYYTCTPVQHTSNFSSYFNTDSVNFILVPIPGIQDLRISLVNTHRGRPGTWTNYNLVYTNAGTAVANGSVYLIKDHRLNIGTATPNYSSVSGDTITWLYSNLVPNETRNITIQLPIPIPPTMNVGDTMISSAVIEPIPSDVVPSDNYSATNITVVGSMDPNDKAMMQGTQFTSTQVSNGDYFNYVIRFQNTGTDTAFKVVIKDTLDNKLNGSSFEMISSSHNYTVGLENQKNITWTFDNILLVDSNHNEPASHGYVAYRVKPMSNVTLGDIIKNNASIFFDYNLPVVTNTFVTSIIFPNSVPDIGNLATDIRLFPNPGKGAVSIGYSLSKTAHVRIEIFNSDGQSVSLVNNSNQTAGKKEVILDESKLPAGIYFLKFSVDNDATTIKLIKM